jgi:hypothetical protein
MEVILSIVTKVYQVISQVFGAIAKLVGWLYGMYIKFFVAAIEKMLSFIGITGGVGEAWDKTVAYIEMGVNAVIDFLNKLIYAFNIANNLWGGDDIEPIDRVEWGKASEAVEDLADTIEKQYIPTLDELAAASDMVRTATLATFDALVKESTGWVEIKKTRDDAMSAYDEVINQVNEGSASFKDLKQSLFDAGLGTLDYARKIIEAGGSTQDAVKAVKKGREEFVDTAIAMGYTAEKAAELADKAGLVPKDVRTAFQADGLGNLQNMIDNLTKLNQITNNALFQQGINGEVNQYQERKNILTTKIETAMTMTFGLGQDKNNPLWVQVVNGGLGTNDSGTQDRDGDPTTPAAAGGTFMPRMGGTVVRVAEAGFPERIEPLDRMGLSDRDRAIIAQLSGGGGGGANTTFNVYPATGMDERELAEAVSRKVAWQMRKGV